MIPYLLHTILLLSAYFVFYKFLLESETFFKLNRWILILGIILSVIIPWIKIPQHWALAINSRSILEVFENPQESPVAPTASEEEMIEVAPEAPPSKPSLAPTPSLNPVQKTNQALTHLSIFQVIWYVYLFGVLIFSLNLLIQFAFLIGQILRRPNFPDGLFRIIEMKEDKAPFSFLNYIFINPDNYDWETYEQILKHEKIHILQGHSIDLILGEILIILQWFNPFAWAYRKVLENNLEYLTDACMLSQGNNRQLYQMSLLKVTVPNYPLKITNNYNQSFLKKRITMMNAKKSSFQSLWKYFFLIPLLGIAMITLNEVYSPLRAQEIVPQVTIVKKPKTHKATKPPKVALDISENISVQPEVQVLEPVPKPKPMQNQRTVINTSAMETKGLWQAWQEGDQVCFNLTGSNKNKERRNHWMQSECFKKSEIGNLPQNQEGTFQITREAGVLSFTGKFEGDEGYGRFDFQVNEAFQNFLNQSGFPDADEKTVFQLFLSNMGKSYISFLKSKGYGDIGAKYLKRLAIFDVTEQDLSTYLKEFNQIPVEQIIKLAIHDVDEAYIRDLKQVGYKNLSANTIIKASIHDVSPEYINELAKLGYKNLPIEKVIKMSIHDIDIDFVNELKQLGYTDLTSEQLVKARIHNVNLAQVKDLQSVGYDNFSLEELVKLSIHDVDSKLVNMLKSLGYNSLSAGELTKAAIHDVDEDLVNSLKAEGYSNIPFETLIRLAVHDIDGNFIKEMADIGFKDESLGMLIKARIHDATPKYIKAMRSKGLEYNELERYIRLRIADVE